VDVNLLKCASASWLAVGEVHSIPSAGQVAAKGKAATLAHGARKHPALGCSF